MNHITRRLRADFIAYATCCEKCELTAGDRFDAWLAERDREALTAAAEWWAENPDHHAFETPGDIRNWLREGAPREKETA